MFFSFFSPSNKGCQCQSRGHGSCFPSRANEAMGFSRKGMWTHIPVPAFIFVIACERTQFLMDLLKDPILSSVIPMVTPTRCHRANGGNPIAGEF